MSKVDDIDIVVTGCSPIIADAKGNLFQACSIRINNVSHSAVIINDRLQKIDNQIPIRITGKIADDIKNKDGVVLTKKELGELLRRIEFLVTPKGLSKARYRSLAKEIEYLKNERDRRNKLKVRSKEYENMSDRELNQKIVGNLSAMIRLKQEVLNPTIDL